MLDEDEPAGNGDPAHLTERGDDVCPGEQVRQGVVGADDDLGGGVRERQRAHVRDDGAGQLRRDGPGALPVDQPAQRLEGHVTGDHPVTQLREGQRLGADSGGAVEDTTRPGPIRELCRDERVQGRPLPPRALPPVREDPLVVGGEVVVGRPQRSQIGHPEITPRDHRSRRIQR